MSLKQTNAFSPAAYITSIADQPETYTLTSGASKSGTVEINMCDTSTDGEAFWLEGREQILTLVRHADNTFGSTLNGYMRLDPEFALTDAPGSVNFQVNATDVRAMIPGMFNPDTGDQLIVISAASTPTTAIRKLDLDTLVPGVVNPFTGGPNGDFNANNSDVLAGNEGYWTLTGSPVGRGMFFDGLKDGIAGETLSTGDDVYPQGLYLARTGAAYWNGFARNGFNFTWIDVYTRRAVGRLGGGLLSTEYPTGFPVRATTTAPSLASNSQSEPPIGNDSFTWNCRQYVPDGDATYTQPKGRLIFVSHEPIPSPISSNPDQKVYLRIIDFNPFGVTAEPGQPGRVHGRVRLTSRWNMEFDPAFGLSGQSTSQVRTDHKGIIFDPRRNRFVNSQRNNAVSGAPASPFGVAANTTVGFLSLQVELANITAPVSLDVPRTGTVVEYQTVLKGDIAEPIFGQEVAWTLERVSTEDEVLDASTFPGTSTVANAPIDTVHSGAAILTIEADGTPLTVTTDYTVDAATGVITWVTDQSGAALVTATYEHRTANASPAHGTLISSTSTTDENGVARTKVFYADNDALVGKLDIITVAAV